MINAVRFNFRLLWLAVRVFFHTLLCRAHRDGFDHVWVRVGGKIRPARLLRNNSMTMWVRLCHDDSVIKRKLHRDLVVNAAGERVGTV